MPLLFAVTMFVSASLLFMVQPMVAKGVLPLLGGSPAVWNGCMVFFQALLLLGYLYADRLTRVSDTRKQWIIHLAVLALPVAVFVLAVLFSAKHNPIAVVEALAPSDGSSPILSVLAILTVAIGVPFFVCSTTATLLQKWFTYTGHPSARDPYFLYAASNLGSLISLLGYPFLIEPNMTQGHQTWFWAFGFAALAGLIAFCGKAAVNPLGVPPTAKEVGKSHAKAAGPAVTGGEKGVAPPAGEPPPSWARMAKWTLLAFVPSSLMLGVTFHMTTDIASIPLLWVGPLALYLVTFIIAFSRVPPWFRILIGNLAPVMILLLVFLLISGVNPGIGLSLMLHLLTFFAAALMCHYELARDRPSPQYLTTYFLIMSLGGVLGGIFNSLLAPILFAQDYEYKLVLMVSCLMVPRLNPLGQDEKESKMSNTTAFVADAAINPSTNWLVYGVRWIMRLIDRDPRVRIGLDMAIPIFVGLVFWQLQKVTGFETYGDMMRRVSKTLTVGVQTIHIVIVYAMPVMVCFFFVDRPLRFALCVAAILGISVFRDRDRDVLHTERSFFGILKIEETESRQPLIDRTRYDKLTDEGLTAMRKAGVPETVLEKITTLGDKEWTRHEFERELAKLLTAEELKKHEDAILKNTFTRQNPGESSVRDESGKPIVAGRYKYRRLVHGTTLHGTQVAEHERHFLDTFQVLTAANPLDNVTAFGVIQHFNMREEPLTYYHRTGPVGAMFAELTRRGNGKEHVAMVGLGTGSVSCYAQKGQKLTYYEIDPAVKRLVADTDQYFTYVGDARRRGSEIDFKMGDARLKLKEDTDRKYALLLIDAFSSDSIPVHLLTNEAVALYLDRLTKDGILALHISNKFVRLEPVVAAIAKHHNLVARVWNDDSEGRHGKTASSWVALASEEEHLGPRIGSPIGKLVGEYGTSAPLIRILRDKYPELVAVLDKSPLNQQDRLLEYLDSRTSDDTAKGYAALVRKHSASATLMTVLQAETGYGFRPVEELKGVEAWTDDYADVMRVMMIPELQAVRKFFGLPTPVER